MEDETVALPTAGPGDSTINDYATYEEYLDSQITSIDLYYLEVHWTCISSPPVSIY
jgi:hypothetical protein